MKTLVEKVGTVFAKLQLMNEINYNLLGNSSHPFEVDFTNSDRQRQSWVSFSIRQDSCRAIVTEILKMVVTHDRKEVK